MLDQLKAEAQDALENLRDLARGIYPPLLADQGLVAALESQARKSRCRSTVESTPAGRPLPAGHRGGRVLLHAGGAAERGEVRAARRGATVRLAQATVGSTFEVDDDGVGFDTRPPGSGTGIQGMADRLAALGGELTVTSAPGVGTLIEGHVPVDGTVPAASV